MNMAELLAGGEKGLQKMRPVQAESVDVFEWPEFRALADRLGIPLDKDNVWLRVTLQGREPVLVEQTFLANDAAGMPLPPRPQQQSQPSGEQKVPVVPKCLVCGAGCSVSLTPICTHNSGTVFLCDYCKKSVANGLAPNVDPRSNAEELKELQKVCHDAMNADKVRMEELRKACRAVK